MFEGLRVVPQDDIYTLFLTSDDGSKLYIHDTLGIDNDGLHAMRQRAGRVKLKAGPHPLRIEFFEAGGRAGLTLHVAGGDINRDGNVDPANLSVLLAFFGTTCP